ncbi:ATP-binding protein [Adlercreutzia equolifaciens]|uniref:ATP-binding protein n=1 Tax=Adlercreutzia equolifaciens TaxID=446660 RepID=UPI0023B1A702|nr:ATP-binding protein [Adlercreutzia equolifaciens]MDE8701631.1 ATP-binding protein [Adlercreutzia equolifaciens]
METFNENPEQNEETAEAALFDYSFVETTGRIALYDDLRSAPRVIDIPPSETAAYIEALASNIYEQARGAGGSIPYSVIREVSENFIHARFREVVVSILDHGNTIRFADHGPGIPAKEKAQMPGFTSASEPMKQYIRGVGSGLPLVRDYMESFRGTITIDDNLGTGAVVTVSLVHDPLDDPAALEQELQREQQAFAETALQAAPSMAAASAPGAAPTLGAAAASMAPAVPANAYPAAPYPVTAAPAVQPGMAQPLATAPMAAAPVAQPYPVQPAAQPGYPAYPAAPAYGYGVPGALAGPPLSDREREFLKYFLSEGILGITDMKNITGHPGSTVHTTMEKLQEAGLIGRVGQKRALTPYGEQVARSI